MSGSRISESSISESRKVRRTVLGNFYKEFGRDIDLDKIMEEKFEEYEQLIMCSHDDPKYLKVFPKKKYNIDKELHIIFNHIFREHKKNISNARKIGENIDKYLIIAIERTKRFIIFSEKNNFSIVIHKHAVEIIFRELFVEIFNILDITMATIKFTFNFADILSRSVSTYYAGTYKEHVDIVKNIFPGRIKLVSEGMMLPFTPIEENKLLEILEIIKRKLKQKWYSSLSKKKDSGETFDMEQFRIEMQCGIIYRIDIFIIKLIKCYEDMIYPSYLSMYKGYLEIFLKYMGTNYIKYFFEFNEKIISKENGKIFSERMAILEKNKNFSEIISEFGKDLDKFEWIFNKIAKNNIIIRRNIKNNNFLFLEQIINSTKVPIQVKCNSIPKNVKMLEYCLRNNIIEKYFPERYIYNHISSDILIFLTKYYIVDGLQDTQEISQKIDIIFKRTHSFAIGTEFNELIGFSDSVDSRINRLREVIRDKFNNRHHFSGLFSQRNIEIYEKILADRFRTMKYAKKIMNYSGIVKGWKIFDPNNYKISRKRLNTDKCWCSAEIWNMMYVNLRDCKDYCKSHNIHKTSYCIPLKMAEEFMIHEYKTCESKCIVDLLYAIENFDNLSTNSQLKLYELLFVRYPSIINDKLNSHFWLRKNMRVKFLGQLHAYNILTNGRAFPDQKILPNDIIFHLISYIDHTFYLSFTDDPNSIEYTRESIEMVEESEEENEEESEEENEEESEEESDEESDEESEVEYEDKVEYVDEVEEEEVEEEDEVEENDN